MPWRSWRVQAAAIALMLGALPEGMRALPFFPYWLERGLLFVGALWFINLVNFMDGIDWMMVAEVVPVTAGIAVIGALGALPPEALLVALALNGAMLGFAPFNRPVARLFMGDMGSLPIGLLLAWLLILVAGSGHLVAALLLPLYFVADTSVTLLRRARAGEKLWVAHRTHFYQRARDNGFTNMEIVRRVFLVNVGLVVLAALSVVDVTAWSSAAGAAHRRRPRRLAAGFLRARAPMSARVLVTGASGFVGRALVDALADAGHRVRATTRQGAEAKFRVGVETVATGDYRQPVDWAPLLTGVDSVVHLAGIAHIGPAIDEAAYDRVVHLATAELAAACSKAAVRRLVFMSSVRAQSGPAADGVLTENDAPRPTEAYGRAKLRAEAAVSAAGVPWTILRPTMVYGAGAKGNLARLLRVADSPWPLPFAGLANQRSLVSLDNLIAAVRFVLGADVAARQAVPRRRSDAGDIAADHRRATSRPRARAAPLSGAASGLCASVQVDRTRRRLGSHRRIAGRRSGQADRRRLAA